MRCSGRLLAIELMTMFLARASGAGEDPQSAPVPREEIDLVLARLDALNSPCAYSLAKREVLLPAPEALAGFGDCEPALAAAVRSLRSGPLRIPAAAAREFQRLWSRAAGLAGARRTAGVASVLSSAHRSVHLESEDSPMPIRSRTESLLLYFDPDNTHLHVWHPLQPILLLELRRVLDPFPIDAFKAGSWRDHGRWERAAAVGASAGASGYVVRPPRPGSVRYLLLSGQGLPLGTTLCFPDLILHASIDYGRIREDSDVVWIRRVMAVTSAATHVRLTEYVLRNVRFDLDPEATRIELPDSCRLFDHRGGPVADLGVARRRWPRDVTALLESGPFRPTLSLEEAVKEIPNE